MAGLTSSIPSSVVGGQKGARGSVTVTVKNFGPFASAGPVTITVYGSTDGEVGGASALTLGHVTKKLKLSSLQSKSLKIKVAVPAPPADADYFLLATATGPTATGTSQVGQGLLEVHVARPLVNLVSASATPPPVTLRPGHATRFALPVQNTGNVAAKGTITVDIFASTNGTLDASNAISLASGARVRISINAGATKMLKLKATLPTTLPAIFPGTADMLIVRLGGSMLTAPNASDGTVLGSVPFTIG